MRILTGIIVSLSLMACSAGTGGTGTGSGSGSTGDGSASTGGGDTGGDTTGGTGTTTGIPVTGTPIGQICDQDHACHDSQDCVGSKDSSVTYCTIECGQSKLGAKTAPDGGPQLCDQCPTISGGAACNTTVPNKDGKTETWLCGITCGGSNQCPTGLTCNNGNCQ